MPLVKWLRRNNRKVMAVVVIVIMIGFIGGSYLQQLGRRRTGLHRTVAYFAGDQKITNYDLAMARQELEILRMVRADQLLKSITVALLRTPDFRALLLGELLFSERQIAPTLIRNIKEIISRNEYRISEKQINDIYRRPAGKEMDWLYWLLLKNEARRAGLRMSNEDAGRELAKTMPQLTGGASYAQVVSSIVRRQGISEDKVLETFGELLTVLRYARTVCSGTDLTDSQIMHGVSWEQETVDVELVRFDSAVFAEGQTEPTEEQLAGHFESYKGFFAGEISDANPYGFGYKLPERVQLEYIAVKLDDVSGIVAAPTHQEAEEYYQNHKAEFTKSIPSDPNDPNSAPVERSRSYAEVAAVISNMLGREKINSKAEMILREAGLLTEGRLQEPDAELGALSVEQLKEMAGDYQDAANQLKERNQIDVYTGRTGPLSAADMSGDAQLGMMYVQGYGYNNPVELTRIVFAIDELGCSELGQFDAPKPRMYENIGPAKDMLGQIMAIVRVVGAEKAAKPAEISQIVNKQTFRLDRTAPSITEDTYSIQEKVTEDLKKLAAMDTTRVKAEEFIELAKKDGWDAALDKYNELYGEKADTDAGKPFQMQKLTELRRIPKMALRDLAVRSAGNPSAQLSIGEIQKESQLREKLYSVAAEDANSPEKAPLVLEFKPNMSFYCVKDISVKRLDRARYDQLKAIRVYREEFIQSQSLAAVHFNPENILMRTAFRWASKERQAVDPNTQPEPEG